MGNYFHSDSLLCTFGEGTLARKRRVTESRAPPPGSHLGPDRENHTPKPESRQDRVGGEKKELVQPKGWRSRKESLARPRTRSGVMAR